MKRHELMDEQWALIEPLVPLSKARTGRPPRDRRILLNGIFWILHTGAPWRDLPERFGPWQTVYHHFSKWRRDGVFAEIIEALQITLDQASDPDLQPFGIYGFDKVAEVSLLRGFTRALAGVDRLFLRKCFLLQ